MKRNRSIFLKDWLNSENRKPLIIRGARQVGKTWLVRDLAKNKNKELIEFNFEKRPELQSLFSSNDPHQIISLISAYLGKNIDIRKSILFLDEIQNAPNILSKLRWFSEDMSDLAVIATGSLLDFALEKHEFSMPVGRIGYMYLEPLSFEEFLDALGHSHLIDFLKNFNFDISIPDVIHNQFLTLLKEYLIIGGMPATVSSWSKEKNLDTINQIHYDLLSTYRDDFSKYSGRLPLNRLEDIINSVPNQLGKKFVYNRANPDVGSNASKQGLELVSKARLCHQVFLTSTNGLPLAAETNEKFFKVIMLDIGLCNVSLGLSLYELSSINELSMINNGSLSEQLTGQLLRTLFPAYISPRLFYWQQTKKNSEAEIDYIIQHQSMIVPIEVKSGKTGSLKSLHYFMAEKNKNLAVRINSDKPSIHHINTQTSSTSPSNYILTSVPFYLIEQLPRLLNLVKTS